MIMKLLKKFYEWWIKGTVAEPWPTAKELLKKKNPKIKEIQNAVHSKDLPKLLELQKRIIEQNKKHPYALFIKEWQDLKDEGRKLGIDVPVPRCIKGMVK